MRSGLKMALLPQGGVGPRLSLMHALNFLGVGIYMPFFPIWLASRGLGDVAISVVLTIPILMRVVATSWVTGLADSRLPPVLLLAALNGLAALLYLALLPAHGIWLIGITMALNAAAISGVVPLADVLTTAQIKAGAAIDYGRVRLWGSVSFFAANLLGGYLIARLGAGIIPLALAASTGLAALAALAVPAPPARARPAQEASPVPVGFSPAFRLALVAIACVNATHAALYAFGSLHWRSLGFSDTVIGGLWAVSVVVEVALFLFAGGIVARGTAGFAWIAAGAVAAIIRFGVMALDPGLGVTLLLQLLHGLTFGCAHLGALAVLSALAPEGRRAAAQGGLVALSALASAAMTILSGYLYQRHGSLAFLAMVPLALVGLVLLLLAKRNLPGDTGSRGTTRSTGRALRAGHETAPAKGLT
jgi:PPP family 3-phenylpropionic acid transporter